tara:strand:- start:1817 stop:2716 length:900 start_codon:yes stop_codon:yes gene_type:complete
MIKLPFSVFSKADSYAFMNGRRIQYDFVEESEVYNNDYMSRSTIPDDINEKKHILFLGDSFIFGDKLSNNETIPEHFEKIINNDEYCVINLAINGSSLDHAILRLYQWCNSFPNNIHSIYLGVTGLSRSTHWTCRAEHASPKEPLELFKNHPEHIERFDFVVSSPPDRWDSPAGASQYSMYKAQSKLISKVNSLKKLEESLIQVKYIANVHNFKVYTFSTIQNDWLEAQSSSLNEKSIHEMIEILIADDNFIYQWRPEKMPMGAGYESVKKFLLPCGHWNSDGCNHVAEHVMNDTKNWY